MVDWAMELDTNKDGKISAEDHMTEEEVEIFEFLLEHCDGGKGEKDGALDKCELHNCAVKYFNEE